MEQRAIAVGEFPWPAALYVSTTNTSQSAGRKRPTVNNNHDNTISWSTQSGTFYFSPPPSNKQTNKQKVRGILIVTFGEDLVALFLLLQYQLSTCFESGFYSNYQHVFCLVSIATINMFSVWFLYQLSACFQSGFYTNYQHVFSLVSIPTINMFSVWFLYQLSTCFQSGFYSNYQHVFSLVSISTINMFSVWFLYQLSTCFQSGFYINYQHVFSLLSIATINMFSVWFL